MNNKPWTGQHRDHEVSTTDGEPPELPGESAPKPIGPDGQHRSYWVLSEAERAKGFVRPVRKSYRHIGPRAKYELRDLTPEEAVRYEKYGYAKFEVYPENEAPITGKFWTQAELDRKGCGAITTMGRELSETYAREPKFYSHTFCIRCGSHLPVSEFVWKDTDEVVGS